MGKEDEPVAHQLFKQCSGVTVRFLTAGSTLHNGEGWIILHDYAGSVIIINRLYIDLAGWSQQQLTTFTQGIDIQKERIPVKQLSAVGGEACQEWDYITTRKIQDSELTLNGFLGNESMPGFILNTMDLMEVIYGERMEYANNLQIPGSYVQINGEAFGSGNPTAMDKIHWTRIFKISRPEDSEQYTIFSTNLIIQALTVAETDLVWIERLRRSYALQGD